MQGKNLVPHGAQIGKPRAVIKEWISQYSCSKPSKFKAKKFNLFFDSGCGDLVCRRDAVSCLQGMGRVRKVLDGQLTLSGVGDNKTVCKHGVYNVKNPFA